MRSRNNFVLMQGFVLVFMIAANAASAPTLTFTFTTVNVPGAMATVLGGINNGQTSRHGGSPLGSRAPRLFSV